MPKGNNKKTKAVVEEVIDTKEPHVVSITPAPPQYDRAELYARIRDMVADLAREFGRSMDSLRLFQRLLVRLQEDPTDKASEDKVVELFERFVRVNRRGIMQKDQSLLSTHVIVYHGNVNIKMAEIFRLADATAKATIWAHLQCLLNVIDPDDAEVEAALTAYRKQHESDNGASNAQSNADDIDETSSEAQFIKSIIRDIQPSMNDNTAPGGHPMAGIDIMGMFSKVTSMLDGQNGAGIDPEKLLNTVHKMSMRELSKVKRPPQ